MRSMFCDKCKHRKNVEDDDNIVICRACVQEMIEEEEVPSVRPKRSERTPYSN